MAMQDTQCDRKLKCFRKIIIEVFGVLTEMSETLRTPRGVCTLGWSLASVETGLAQRAGCKIGADRIFTGMRECSAQGVEWGKKES